MVNYIEEMGGGLLTIRAYNKQKQFAQMLQEHVQVKVNSETNMEFVYCWFKSRLSMIVQIQLLVFSLFNMYRVLVSSDLNRGSMALSITYFIILSDTFTENVCKVSHFQ